MLQYPLMRWDMHRPANTLASRLGRSRDGFETKLHLLVDSHGIPFAAVVGRGQRPLQAGECCVPHQRWITG